MKRRDLIRHLKSRTFSDPVANHCKRLASPQRGGGAWGRVSRPVGCVFWTAAASEEQRSRARRRFGWWWRRRKARLKARVTAASQSTVAAALCQRTPRKVGHCHLQKRTNSGGWSMTTPATPLFQLVRVPGSLAGLRANCRRQPRPPRLSPPSWSIIVLVPLSLGTGSLIQVEVPEVPIRAK